MKKINGHFMIIYFQNLFLIEIVELFVHSQSLEYHGKAFSGSRTQAKLN